MRGKIQIFLIASFFLFGAHLRAQEMFYHLLGLTSIAPFTWTGKGADANWNTAANWSTNTVPGASDTATFTGSDACTSNCSPMINISVSVKGLNITSSYAGTITQSSGVTVTVGSDNWQQASGTFLGSNADITVNGSLVVAGGNFRSTSTNLTVTNNFSMSGATFTHNSGNLILSAAWASSVTVTAGASSYNNVTMQGSQANFTLTDTMTVLGTLKSDDNGSYPGVLNTGTFIAKGNVYFANKGRTGTALIRIAGSSNQSITGDANANSPRFEIASTGGIVTLSGSLGFNSTFTYTSGAVDASASTLIFNSNYFDGFDSSGVTLTPGSVTYQNVKFAGYAQAYLISGTMTVAGTLTMGDSHDGGRFKSGTILAKGDVVFNSGGLRGAGLVKLAGAGNQTLSGISTAKIPSIEIASTGGTVTLSGDLLVYGNYTQTSGTVSAGTSKLRFSDDGFDDMAASTITPGTVVYNDVSFEGYSATHNLSGTLSVAGTLTIDDTHSYGGTLNGGSLLASGNVVVSNKGAVGTTTLTLSGSTASTLTVGASSYLISGAVTVNKSGSGSVTLTGNAPFTSSGQTLTINAGVLDLSGYTLNVQSTLTVSSTGTLRCSGGSYTSGGLSNSGTIDCASYTFNWTGASGDGKWSTASNWAGGIVPSSSDIAVFKDAYCGSKCNATIDSAANLKGLRLISPYSGTITQGSGVTFTVGSSGWQQAAGTFSGSNANISISNLFSISGGSFQSTSATLSLSQVAAAIASGVTYNHNSGTTTINSYMGWDSVTQDFGGKDFYNVNVYGNGIMTLASNVIVRGNLTINFAGYNAQIGGQFDLYGDLTLQGFESPGTNVIRFLGSANETVYTSGAVSALSTKMGHLLIQKTAGTLTFTGNTSIAGLEYTSGGVSFPAGFTTVFEHTGNCWAQDTWTPGNIQFSTVIISGCGPRSINGTMLVGGDLTIDINYSAAGLRNGKIQVAGNYTLVRDEDYSSSTEIEMVGASNATVTDSSNYYNPGNFTVSKTGGATVTLASNFFVANSSFGLHLISGNLNMAGYNLTISNSSGTDNVLTLESGTTLTRGGGTLTYEALVNNGGTINP